MSLGAGQLRLIDVLDDSAVDEYLRQAASVRASVPPTSSGADDDQVEVLCHPGLVRSALSFPTLPRGLQVRTTLPRPRQEAVGPSG